MKSLLSFLISTNMVLAPFARAERVVAASVSGVHRLGLSYQRAKLAYQKTGSQDFAKSFEWLSPQDSRFVVSQLARRVTLPDVNFSDTNLTMRFGATELKFDVAYIQDGYVTLDGQKIKANFGGSLQEISDSLAPVLQKKYPAQFDANQKVSTVFDPATWHSFLISDAHAIPAAVVWGGLAVVLGALLFKGIHEERQTANKFAAARDRAYVQEPVYQQAPPVYSAGNPAHSQGSDSSSYVRRTAADPAILPPALGGLPLPPGQPPASDAERKPSSAAVNAPTSDAKKTDVSYAEYESILCNAGEDSIAKIMGNLLKNVEGNRALVASEGVTFHQSKREFAKQVLIKLKELSATPGKEATAAAYLAFVKNNFGLNFNADFAEHIYVDPTLDSLAPTLNSISTYVNIKEKLVEIQFVDESPQLTFNAKTGAMIWVGKPGDNKIEVCSVPVK